MGLNAASITQGSGGKLNAVGLQHEIVLAQICERYHKLPSEVRREDYGELMRVWAIQGRIDRHVNSANRKRK